MSWRNELSTSRAASLSSPGTGRAHPPLRAAHSCRYCEEPVAWMGCCEMHARYGASFTKQDEEDRR